MSIITTVKNRKPFRGFFYFYQNIKRISFKRLYSDNETDVLLTNEIYKQ
jgi:hypothetical protein